MNAIEMTDVRKTFGDFVALEGVTTQVRQGAFHAFVGENGAGKTTLMKALYGAHLPDSGRIVIEGEPRAFRSPNDAIAAGVGMVSQHYAIIPELTPLQNLLLGAEGGAVLDLGAAEARAEGLARRMGFAFDWRASSDDLSPAQAQKLEILKLLWREARMMILDEPTAMLSPADAEALFASLQSLVDEGRTVLLVTHHIPEVMRYCERVTVLRAGRQVADLPVSEVDPLTLARLIVGEDIAPPPPPVPTHLGEAALRVEGLSARAHRAVTDATFSVHGGEVVGIAGVDGSGQRELFWSLLGQLPATGNVTINGRTMTGADTRARLAAGLRLIPEDRHAEGVVGEWSLYENSLLGLQRTGRFGESRSARAAWTERVADAFQTRRPSLGAAIDDLSGGNQQRFVAGRAILSDPKVLLAYQPARGLDIKAIAAVYDGLRQAADQGAGVLVVSYDLDELLERCDRILVMHSGRLVEPVGAEARDRAAIGRLMTGAGGHA